MADAPEHNKKRQRLMAAVLLMGVFAAASIIPVARQDYDYYCRVCGMSRCVSKRQICWFVPLPGKESLHETSDSSFYSAQIGEEHKHQWIGVCHTKSEEDFWVSRHIECGGFEPGPSPVTQINVTKRALRALSEKGIVERPVAWKKELLYRLTNLESEEQIQSAIATAKESDSQQGPCTGSRNLPR